MGTPSSQEKRCPRGLLMTAKLRSRSVCFEPISKSALYQGTTSVVPKRASRTRALAPAALFPSQFGFGQPSAAQPARRTLPLQHSIKPNHSGRSYVRPEGRTLHEGRASFRQPGPRLPSGSLSQAKWLVILLSWIAMGLPSRASDLDGATKVL